MVSYPRMHGVFVAVAVSISLTLARAGPVALVERSGNSWTPVQTAGSTVPSQSAAALPSTPADLDAGVKKLLDQWQPSSSRASADAAAGNLDGYPATGLCSQDYPCFSVDRAGFAVFPSGSHLDVESTNALLSKLTANDRVTFDQSNPNSVLSGLRVSTDKLILDIVAAPSTVESSVLAGEVFDLLKAQGLGGDTNAVRGVAASDQPKIFPAMGLCVYPADADATAASNFCNGKELDGSTTTPATGFPSKRGFDLGSLLDGFCGIVDVPLICPQGKA